MRRPARALCLPVLAAAAVGCLTGLAISGGSGEQVRVTAAAETTPILLTTTPAPQPGSVGATAAPKPATTPKPAAHTPTTKAKPKTTTKAKPKATTKAKPKAKPKAKKKSGSSGSTSAGPRGFTGPKGAAGPAGAPGPAGPVSDAVRSLTVNWRNGDSAVDPSASVVLPGLGTVTVTCTPDAQALSVTPAASGPRTVLDTDTVQGAGTQGATSFDRGASQSTTVPITAPIPNNGLILATISVEPYSGDGGTGPDPATLTISSEWKLNDPIATNNFCFVAGQIVGKP
jgi:hypothetical protein